MPLWPEWWMLQQEVYCAIAEALTNLVWAPMPDRIRSISLSANWMWPCKNEGEDARLYEAAKAASDFAVALGINIPTGKDSLSMTQKYDKQVVYAPGTVIISAAGRSDRCDERLLNRYCVSDPECTDYLCGLCQGCIQAWRQLLCTVPEQVGDEAPTVKDPAYFVKAFNLLQSLIEEGMDPCRS